MSRRTHFLQSIPSLLLQIYPWLGSGHAQRQIGTRLCLSLLAPVVYAWVHHANEVWLTGDVIELHYNLLNKECIDIVGVLTEAEEFLPWYKSVILLCLRSVWMVHRRVQLTEVQSDFSTKTNVISLPKLTWEDF